MLNLFYLIVTVGIAFFGMWSFARMRRFANPSLRWIGVIAATLLTLITVTVATLMILGSIELHSRSAPLRVVAATPTRARLEPGSSAAGRFR